MDLKFILQILQILFALAFVLSMSYGVLRMTKKLTDGNAHYMKIIEKMPLGKEAYLAVMKIGDTYELVSVTSGNLTLLREVDKEAMDKILQDREDMLTKNPLATYLKQTKNPALTSLLRKMKMRMPSE